MARFAVVLAVLLPILPACADPVSMGLGGFPAIERGTPDEHSDIPRLTVQLLSNNAQIAKAAHEQLRRMPDAVPILFRTLVEADWDLKPPIMELLRTIKGAADFARSKLLHGDDAERTYAALLYELSANSADSNSREFSLMVDVLLDSLSDDDRNLRAAATLALTELSEGAILFKHFHAIVPAMISSFDTDLIIRRGRRQDPAEAVFVGTGLRLDLFIGDHLAYTDVESTIWARAGTVDEQHYSAFRHSIRKALASSRKEIDELREYWERWWKQHARLRTAEIGSLIIERNLRFLRDSGYPHSALTKRLSETNEQFLKRREQCHLVGGSLELWTGQRFPSADAWRVWWTEHKGTYDGPLVGTD